MRYGFDGLVSAVVLTLTVVTAGCGSTSGDGAEVGTGGSSSGGAGTGVGGSSSTANPATTLSVTTMLDALTVPEVTQLCTDTYAYFAKAIPLVTACQYKGLSYATSSSAPSDSQFQQVCKDHEASCTQTASGVGSADSPGCGDIPVTCPATVAQYSACISDEVAIFNQGMSGLPSCATATSAAISAVWKVIAPTPPASCDLLNLTCPGLSPPNPTY
jgi:hypothetical protein